LEILLGITIYLIVSASGSNLPYAGGAKKPPSKSLRNIPKRNNPPPPPAAVEGARGVGAVRPSRSCREPQQEQTCGPRYGLRRSSVMREGLGPSLIPAPAPTSTASSPLHAEACGG